eukprot:TRINITY_DN4141_c0_g1_i1.p1 TRINITY_DN4141_c0_g1~~TRINITY_DN4141_c0_g1_i1.p1  ORF type:complete len:335 (+),score=68.54 TRINITY_DN4141_c0_g1_i1:40-1044(+)
MFLSTALTSNLINVHIQIEAIQQKKQQSAQKLHEDIESLQQKKANSDAQETQEIDRKIAAKEEEQKWEERFMSSAISGSGSVSFAELKEAIHKYSATLPKDGPLRRLFEFIEHDTKGRVSDLSVAAMVKDLEVLVADFHRLDVQNRNAVSRKDFREHFIKLGFTRKSVLDALFRHADQDENDIVDFDDYVHLVVCVLVLRIMYTLADTDRSGQLSKEEIKVVLVDANIYQYGAPKFDAWYNQVDADGNSVLSYTEFVALVLFLFCDEPIPVVSDPLLDSVTTPPPSTPVPSTSTSASSSQSQQQQHHHHHSNSGGLLGVGISLGGKKKGGLGLF